MEQEQQIESVVDEIVNTTGTEVAMTAPAMTEEDQERILREVEKLAEDYAEGMLVPDESNEELLKTYTKEVVEKIRKHGIPKNKHAINYQHFLCWDDITKSQFMYQTQRSLEHALFNMIHKDPFYSNTFIQVRRRIDWRLPTAYVTIDPTNGDFVFGYNPGFIFSMTDDEIMGVIKHELLHIIFQHITTRRPFSKDEASLSNIAQDMAINSIVGEKNLPDIVILPGKPFKRDKAGKVSTQTAAQKHVSEKFEEFVVNSPKLQAYEYYFKRLRELRDQLQDEMDDSDMEGAGDVDVAASFGDSFDDHGVWDDVSDAMKEKMQEKLRDILSDAIKKSDRNNQWGTVPMEIVKGIREFISREVDWKVVLRSFIGRSKSTESAASWARLNRRTPYLAPGKKKKTHADVVVTLDQSGSVGDDDLEMFFGELSSMSKETNFDLYFFDTEMDLENKITWKRGMKVTPRRTRCGGTDFNAVADFVNDPKNNGKWNGVIILTDGYAPKMKAIYGNRKVLWVITESGTMEHVRDGDLVIKMKSGAKNAQAA